MNSSISKRAMGHALSIWRIGFRFVQAVPDQTDASRIAAVVSVMVGLLVFMTLVGPFIEAGVLILVAGVFVGVRGLIGKTEEDLDHHE